MLKSNDMTSIHTSEQANKRLAKRYSFERRFKFMGMFSVLLAVLALVALLWTVFGKAFGALTETYVTLDVTYTKEDVDPSGKANPEEIGQQDLDILWKTAIRKAFPTVKGRSDRFALYKLISGAAGLELRDAVKADTSLIGKTVTFDLLADDEVDLYFKGYAGTLKALDNNGTATLVQEEDVVKVSFSETILGSILADVKTNLLNNAKRVDRQTRAQQRAVTVFEMQLKNAKTDEQKEAVTSRLDAAKAQRDTLLEKAKQLRVEAENTSTTGALSADLPSVFVYVNGGVVKATRITPNGLEGNVVLPLSSLEPAKAGAWDVKVNPVAESARKITDKQIIWVEKLKSEGRIQNTFNWRFFSAADSREPERAGVWGAVVGSFWTMLVTLVLAFPIGVMAAIYLEEFAPKNAITDFIEVNINNLAAVPSIIFGLLGLAVFLWIFPFYRSAPLIGGMVLALMTLPTIIIAGRAAIKAVPPSIREAALGVGASKNQAVFHHVLPLAMPGILTGTIIGMAQALGETAPLLLIGMVAFIKDIPASVVEPATVLPVQIFRWADFPERAFEMRTAAAIVVLLLFLVAMNAIAIFLRQKFERKW